MRQKHELILLVLAVTTVCACCCVNSVRCDHRGLRSSYRDDYGSYLAQPSKKHSPIGAHQRQIRCKTNTFNPTMPASASQNAAAANLHAPESDLCEQTARVFNAGGALARASASYRPRSAQQDMAQAVAQTIDQASTLVVEAGTGTGKTFAYLVPALLSNQRVLISTATKTLQDQLYTRDLPQVLSALGLPTRTALLKGRSNYLCLLRTKQARQQHLSTEQLQQLAKVERWLRHTQTGDFAELTDLVDGASVLPWVSSTRENCLGQNCPDYKECHIVRARREAMQADVVVINHHLFFADMAVRESGVAELLPRAGVVIFDEAHQLNETGVQFLGQRLNSSQLLDFCRDTLVAGLQRARGLLDWQDLVETLEYATREFRLLLGSSYNKAQGSTRLRWAQLQPEGIDAEDWRSGLQDLGAALGGLATALDSVTEISPELTRLFERAQELQSTLAHFSRSHNGVGVRWLEVSSHWGMIEAPLDIATAMQARLQPATSQKNEIHEGIMELEAENAAWAASENIANYGDSTLPSLVALQPPGTPAAEESPAPTPTSWIFTSATLGDASSLKWFTQPCGLEAAASLRLASPFAYPEQAVLYAPSDLPAPSDTVAHSLAVAELVAQSARILGGRTLVLTTTNRALRAIASSLRELLANSSIEVLEQGAAAKHELIDKLRSASSEKGHVLVATASLWEGIDIAGDALQLVVIDKLPFPPPGDPLIEARTQRLEAQGKSAFNHYAMPEAAVALKQGAGRLIRSESDRGALVICDPRLGNTPYGKRLLKALPPMRQLDDPSSLCRYLQSLKNQPNV